MTNYLEQLHNVSPKIIERGKQYYEDGKISNFHAESHIFYGKVEGNEGCYDTYVTIKDNKVESYSCSCPCTFLCKHVVALLFKVEEEKKKKQEKPFDSLKKKISSTAFSENLEEFKGLPYKINGFLPYLSKNEYTSLIVLYLSKMAKSESLLSDGNLVQRYNIFNEKAKFDHDALKSIISSSLDSLKDSPDGTYNFISSFLKDESTSEQMQEYILSEYQKENRSIKSALTCLSGKSLPRYLSPSFTCLLTKVSPRLVSDENLLIAKEEFKKECSNDDLLVVLRLLLTRGNFSLIEDDDFAFLKDNGLVQEARSIAFSILKSSDDFYDYLRYRKLYSNKEYFPIRYQVSMAISYKTYLNAALLIDGKEFFPELYETFSYESLSPKDVYLARTFIKDKKDIHILTEIAHKYIKGELAKKNRNKDYFYYLLYLDYLRDDSLSYYLFKEEVLADKETKKTRGVWLYLLENNDLLKRINAFSYGGLKVCL